MIIVWLILIKLLIIALAFFIYPLREALKHAKTRRPILIVAVAIAWSSTYIYHHIGNAQGVHNARLLAELNDIGAYSADNPGLLDEIILGLEKQLDKHPIDAISWALLGKVYFTLQDYPASVHAYAQAYAILPDDPDLMVEYATSLYLSQDEANAPQLQQLIIQLQNVVHQTPASLSLLANVALDQGDYQAAIGYWRAIQQQVPEDSELYRELELTIEFINLQYTGSEE